MNGFCVRCGANAEISKRGICKDCAKKAMQAGQKLTTLKMILKIRRVEK